MSSAILGESGSQPGFVLSGRSLTEVEKRESQLTQIVGFGWLAALVGSLLASALALAISDGKLWKRKS